MFYKLVIRNVLKSLKDYAIYFVTLVFGVCLFYAFNSINSQTALLKISESSREVIKNMLRMINIMSIFISVILGCLMVYASNFLIKRRKKEFGIYMTLGMKKSKILGVLILETFTIGVVSLVIGLIVGAFLSQILSIITASIFEVELTEFKFIFSKKAMIKTVKYFSIMYLVEILFNAIAISKYKLIDLFTASRKNEKLKIKTLKCSVFIFIISIVLLVVSYLFFMKEGMSKYSTKFNLAIVFGCVGTFLFFLSLSGFWLKVVKLNKKIYYKKINMFVLRQVNSNITTTFVSMSIICIMLLIAICVLSTGIGASSLFNRNIRELTPYDMTISSYEKGDEGREDIEKFLTIVKEAESSIDENIEKSTFFKTYKYENTDGHELYKYVQESKDNSRLSIEYLKKTKLTLISLSDYNNNMKLQGKQTITLEDNQVMISYNNKHVNSGIDMFLKEDGKLTINGKKYNCVNMQVKNNFYVSTTYVSDMGKVIVPDDVVKSAEMDKIFVNINFKGNENDITKYSEKLVSVIESDSVMDKYVNNSLSAMYLTKKQVYDENKTRAVMVSFIAIYIGFVFVIASAAILALKQLSESSDNMVRYGLLRKIGVDEKEINKSIFKQIAITFIMPLTLAMIHSIVGIKVANDVLETYGYKDAITGVTSAALFIIAIYGGYMLLTYFGCKATLKR